MTDFVDYEDAEKVLQAEAMEMRQMGISEERIAEATAFSKTLQNQGGYPKIVRQRHQMILDGEYVNGQFVNA